MTAAIRVTAFQWVPPVAQGLVRDLRVRWALEEAGIAYEEGDLRLFESGAIVLHIGERCSALLPRDPARRARAAA